MNITPTPADKFSFGLWTIGWVGVGITSAATHLQKRIVRR